MRLHRYFPDHADTSLKERQLWLSKPSTFNDPFEFIHRHVGGWDVEKVSRMFAGSIPLVEARHLSASLALLNSEFTFGTDPFDNLAKFFVSTNPNVPEVDCEACHRAADEFLRVTCFSETDVTSQSEILLWSHYANKHQGVRIEFEFEDDHSALFKVLYESERVAIPFIDYVTGGSFPNFIRTAMRVKYSAWEYEREFRLILATDKNAKENPSAPCYFPFSPDMVKRVDFGINCSGDLIQRVSEALGDGYGLVEMRQAVRHRDLFGIDYISLSR